MAMNAGDWLDDLVAWVQVANHRLEPRDHGSSRGSGAPRAGLANGEIRVVRSRCSPGQDIVFRKTLAVF